MHPGKRKCLTILDFSLITQSLSTFTRRHCSPVESPPSLCTGAVRAEEDGHQVRVRRDVRWDEEVGVGPVDLHVAAALVHQHRAITISDLDKVVWTWINILYSVCREPC